MKWKQFLGIVFLVACAGVLLACTPPAPTDGQTGAPGFDLNGTAWALTSLNGEPPIAGTELTLEFQDGNISGSGGCNTFGGTYTTDDGSLTITELYATEIACESPEGVMQQEQTYLETLRQAAGYSVTDDELTLTDEAGDAVLTYTRQQAATPDPALAGSGWTLVSLDGEPPLEETNVTLNISQDEPGDRVHGFAGCNEYGAELTTASDRTFTVAPPEVTAELCETPNGVMEQEDAYLEALVAATSYTVTDERLEFADASGDTILVFERQPAYSMNPTDLIGTEWRLVSLDGADPIGDTAITLGFHDEQRAGGHAGCRDYVVGYVAEGDALDVTQTSMLDNDTCPDDENLLEQEGHYTTVLSWVANYRLADDRLELFTARGETLTFEPLPADAVPALEGTTWRLGGFIDVPTGENGEPTTMLVTTPVVETTPTITFQDGQVAGSTGCNRFTGHYTRGDDRLTIDDLEWTEEGCNVPEGAREQEQRYLDALRQADGYHLLAGQLWLETNDGPTLIFSV